jgi:PhnB protein
MSKTRAIPEGYHSITPSLTCKNAAAAIEFYKQVFGAKELFRMPTPDGKVAHAELSIGDSRFMVNDEFQPMATISAGTRPVYLFLYVEDADTTFNNAVKHGARTDTPLENQFWGDRFGRITDPFGHQWGIATHVEDVSPAEMERRSAEAMAKMAKAAHAQAGKHS